MNRLVKFPFHPILLALFPTISLFTHNLGQVTVSELPKPLIASLSIGALIFLAAMLLYRNASKAAVLTSLILILFFGFESIRATLMRVVDIDGFYPWYYRYYLPALALVIIGAAVLLFRAKGNFINLTVIINVAALGAWIMPIYQIASYNVYQRSADLRFQDRAAAGGGAVSIAPKAAEESPDIYLIVLDMYGRADRLQAALQFDNSGFVSQLEDAGFYVAHCATSNYSHTTMSIASLLNMDYLDALNGGELPEQYDQAWLKTLVKESRVVEELRKAGYKFVAFQHNFPFLNLTGADVYYPIPSRVDGNSEVNLTAFEKLWLERTPVNFVVNKINELFINEITIRKHGSIYRQTLFTLDKLQEIPTAVSGPKFVYAHLLIPHPPYIFLPDGMYTEDPRFNGPNGLPVDEQAFQEAVTNQIQYINSRIIPILKTIIQNSEKPPVIILTGDHGFFGGAINLMPILHAYHLPGVDESVLYPTITPVNSFRLVFNEYFDAGYALLEDQAFESVDVEDWFIMSEYTNREADCAAP